jgi:hypothetical protein
MRSNDGDARALAREAQSDRLTDAAAAAGNKRSLAL